MEAPAAVVPKITPGTLPLLDAETLHEWTVLHQTYSSTLEAVRNSWQGQSGDSSAACMQNYILLQPSLALSLLWTSPALAGVAQDTGQNARGKDSLGGDLESLLSIGFTF